VPRRIVGAGASFNHQRPANASIGSTVADHRCPVGHAVSLRPFEEDTMPGPLHGITVIDISAVISGPMCCQVLADQGAEVIKIEPHGIGDITRIGAYRVGDISPMFGAANRGKRSVALDLTKPEGIDVVKQLARSADVFVQNFRPGAVDRMGIGADDLLAINPDLIYVSISGFGPTGPYHDWRVYDPVIQALSGVVSVQMSMDIPIPDLIRTLVADKSTALTAAQAVTAALFARATGKARGQHLVIPMLDSFLYWLWPDLFMKHSFTGEGTVPGPLLYQIYRLQPTSDGHVVYFAASDNEWRGLVTAVGHPEWWDDERFNNIPGRIANFPAIGAMLHDAFLELATDDALQRLHHHEVPAAPVLSLEEMFDDEQVRHNEAIHTWDHPTVGPVRQAKPPVRWSHTAHETVWGMDSLGASTESVLRSHGYDDATLDVLRSVGVIR
jgi:crotonobetainyl-CoA:carnitine CoA-transferase CaiB-like acyl-CoA transferase